MANEVSSAPKSAEARDNISALDSRSALRRTLLGLIVLLAAHLRLHALAARSFWLDEGVSAELSRLRWSQFFLVLWHREANMALYYVLLHYWMKFGSSEAFVRGLSVIFAVATVPLIYALGKRLFGATVGLIAAWLLAINWYHIYYSQEARSYALTIFLVTLSTWLLVRNLQEPASARWWSYALVSALSFYGHFFAALVIVAQGASLLCVRGNSFPWRDYARSVRWIVYMILPLAIVAARIGGAPVDWIQRTSIPQFYYFFRDLTGAGSAWLLVLDALAIVLAAFAAWRVLRKRDRAHEASSWSNAQSYALAFSWFFVPVLLTIAVSLFRPFFVVRYLIFCLPALMLLIAVGIARLRPKALAWMLAVAISALTFQSTHNYFHQGYAPYREDWRSASGYVLNRAQPGDGIIFTPLGRIPFEYYRTQRNPAPSGPASLYAPGGADLVYQDFMVTPLGEVLRDARPAPDRVWIVAAWSRLPNGDFDRTTFMLNAVYGKGRHLADQQEFQNITVELYAAGPESAATNAVSPSK
jgi:mannosyltransferase